MLAEVFERSLDAEAPPIYYTDSLKALWYAAKGDPGTAMDWAQAVASLNEAWVRAHLHRMQQEAGNARLWYSRAQKPMPDTPIERERLTIALTLLSELTVS